MKANDRPGKHEEQQAFHMALGSERIKYERVGGIKKQLVKTGFSFSKKQQ